MHLIIDIGNTNIVFSIIEGDVVKEKWRIATDINRTGDEYYLWLSSILKEKFNPKNVIIGSVVPEVTEEIKTACKNYFNKRIYIINEDVKISFPMNVENIEK